MGVEYRGNTQIIHKNVPSALFRALAMCYGGTVLLFRSHPVDLVDWWPMGIIYTRECPHFYLVLHFHIAATWETAFEAIQFVPQSRQECPHPCQVAPIAAHLPGHGGKRGIRQKLLSWSPEQTPNRTLWSSVFSISCSLTHSQRTADTNSGQDVDKHFCWEGCSSAGLPQSSSPAGDQWASCPALLWKQQGSTTAEKEQGDDSLMKPGEPERSATCPWFHAHFPPRHVFWPRFPEQCTDRCLLPSLCLPPPPKQGHEPPVPTGLWGCTSPCLVKDLRSILSCCRRSVSPASKKLRTARDFSAHVGSTCWA